MRPMQRQHHPQGGALADTRTVGEQSASQGAQGIGTPVQADAGIVVGRLGRKSLFKNARQIFGRDASAVIAETDFKLLACRYALHSAGDSQDLRVAPGIAH